MQKIVSEHVSYESKLSLGRPQILQIRYNMANWERREYSTNWKQGNWRSPWICLPILACLPPMYCSKHALTSYPLSYLLINLFLMCSLCLSSSDNMASFTDSFSYINVWWQQLLMSSTFCASFTSHFALWTLPFPIS